LPRWKEPEPSYEMAVLNAALGDRDSAFRALENACERRFSRAICGKWDSRECGRAR